jgi:hypothetical protein
LLEEDGRLRRRISQSKYKAGTYAGSINAWGHLKVRIGGVFIYAHRIVWAMTYGKWPEKSLDHINGIKTDNRPENLREATDLENNHNVGIRKTNSTGYRGVSVDRRRNAFQAQITVNGKHRYLGHFKTPEEASVAYENAARAFHGEFYRTPENSNV